MHIDYKVPNKLERKVCLVVIDMQNCFFEEEGCLEKYKDRISNIASAIRAFRGHGRDVFIIRFMGENHSDNDDRSLIDGLGDISDCKIVDKYHMSAFFNTELADLMVNGGYDTALLCGSYAEHCVMASYWSCYEHDLSPYLLEGAVIAYDDEKLRSVMDICMYYTLDEMMENLEKVKVDPEEGKLKNRMRRKYWYIN